MIYIQFMVPLIFCSLGVLLTCFAIFQVRRERTEIQIRMTEIEKTLIHLQTLYIQKHISEKGYFK